MHSRSYLHCCHFERHGNGDLFRTFEGAVAACCNMLSRATAEGAHCDLISTLGAAGSFQAVPL